MWRVSVRRGECIGSCWGNQREGDNWGDLGVDGWIILGWLSRRQGCGYMDWIGLAQARDRWRTLVSAVMNLRVPWNVGNFLTSCKPVSFSRRTVHRGVSKCVNVRQGWRQGSSLSGIWERVGWGLCFWDPDTSSRFQKCRGALII